MRSIRAQHVLAILEKHITEDYYNSLKEHESSNSMKNQGKILTGVEIFMAYGTDQNGKEWSHQIGDEKYSLRIPELNHPDSIYRLTCRYRE